MTDYQNEFPLDDGTIYLNHAAVAPWPKCTAEIVKQFAQENQFYGARYYPKWMVVENELRKNLAKLLNAPSSDDIALVKNTSEALSIVASGLSWKSGENVITSNEEFPSNRIPWEALQKQGVELKQVDLQQDDPTTVLINAIDQNTRLLSISSVQYGSGIAVDLVRLGEVCKQKGVLFCVDAIQSIGALETDVQAWQADFVMADGHKWMLGPEGLAVFYSTPEARELIELNQYGWHMVDKHGDFDAKEWIPAKTARRFECGSPNMLGIHALNASIQFLLEIGMDLVEQKVLENAEFTMNEVQKRSNMTLLTSSKKGQFAGIVTFLPQGKNLHSIYSNLMEQGVICAMRGGGIRFSSHFYTSQQKIQDAFQAVDQLLEK
ncbi:MAG: cysteine desulfurase/selenocysteine lyase [bacterium]|jgi:cysteine desulfurase/selenocysteine lyase